ncbi:MAG: segregation/condensation protein A [Myxococcota bacterium]
MQVEARGAAFTVHTDVFDGPLDLLLHLVKRDGISLARLEVSRIADAYLAYLDKLRQLDLAIASDWLVMAATLVHLKSLELLPRPPTLLEDEEEDPRDALLDQLRAYEEAKAAATLLGERPMVQREIFVRQGMEPPAAERPYVSPLDAFGLLDLLHELLARKAAPEPVVRLGDSGPSIGACCRRVVAALGGRGGHFELVGLLRTLALPAERVITFISVLEMSRLQWLDVVQEGHLAPITVTQLVSDEVIDIDLVSGGESRRREEDQLDLPLAERA